MYLPGSIHFGNFVITFIDMLNMTEDYRERRIQMTILLLMAKK
jgi:hypothetical protein